MPGSVPDLKPLWIVHHQHKTLPLGPRGKNAYAVLTVFLDGGGLSAFPRMQQRIHHACRCLALLPTLMLKSASYSASSAPSCSWQLAGFGTVWFKPLLMLSHTVFTCREALVSTGMGRWSDGVKRCVIHYRKWTCKGRLRAKMQGNKKCNWQMIRFFF